MFQTIGNQKAPPAEPIENTKKSEGWSPSKSKVLLIALSIIGIIGLGFAVYGSTMLALYPINAIHNTAAIVMVAVGGFVTLCGIAAAILLIKRGCENRKSVTEPNINKSGKPEDTVEQTKRTQEKKIKKTEVEANLNEKSLELDIPVDIPNEVKKTLDNLFLNGVDNLPVFTKAFTQTPVMSDMVKPIMKGWFLNKSNTAEKKPFIAFKMRCLDTQDEIIKKLALTKEHAQFMDLSPPIERVLTLYNEFGKDLCWFQGGDNFTPHFFNGNFTLKNGELVDNFPERFALLKKMIQEGSGEDTWGIRWEIIQN